MSQREAAKHHRPVPPKKFHEEHPEFCPRMRQEPGLVCDGVSVWWMDYRNQTCLEIWERGKV